MKITLAKLRKNETNTINGFGEVEEGRLFRFKYLKNDEFGIIINDKLYPETSTAFTFVSVDLPSPLKLYNMIENLVSNVVSGNDYSNDIANMTDLITGIERTNT